MTAPYDPAAAAARKGQAGEASRIHPPAAAGQAPAPVQESLRRFEQRAVREELTDRERVFREGAARVIGRRSTLYGGTVEDGRPTQKLPPLYPA
jgi:hypothetical protein